MSLYPDNFKTNQIYEESYNVLEINKGGAETLKKLAELFPDSLSVQKQYANYLLLQKTNASTFLHVFSIEDQANLFLKYSKPDTLSQVKTIMQVALAYLKNGEIEHADTLCRKIEYYLKDSSRVSKQILLDDYYYTAALAALYKQDVDRIFANYLALINTNPGYKNLPKLRRLTSWYLKFHPKFGGF